MGPLPQHRHPGRRGQPHRVGRSGAGHSSGQARPHLPRGGAEEPRQDWRAYRSRGEVEWAGGTLGGPQTQMGACGPGGLSLPGMRVERSLWGAQSGLWPTGGGRPARGRGGGAGLGMRTPAQKLPEHQHSRAKGPQGNRGAPRSGFKQGNHVSSQPTYRGGEAVWAVRGSPRFPGLLQGVQQGRTPQVESEDPDINPALCREGLVRTEVAGSTRRRRS